jgi:hypothetical protein
MIWPHRALKSNVTLFFLRVNGIDISNVKMNSLVCRVRMPGTILVVVVAFFRDKRWVDYDSQDALTCYDHSP